MAEQAKIMTLRDHDTGEAIAPRTDVKALSGEGKKWNYVGFTEDNVVGLIEGTWPCNKNLLDNWYFVGGGSQQGGGQFPINQRGETEYTTPGYTVDRWKMNVAGTTLQIKNGEGLSLTADANGDFSQPFEQNQVLVPGEVYTLSVLVKEISGQAAMTVYGCPTVLPLKVGINSLTFSANEYSYLAVIPVYSLAGSITIIAAKLELGSQQTLAHKEGDKWVLNDVPDYATELEKCQRYYISNIPNARCFVYGIDNLARAIFPTPVPMRINPTIPMPEFRASNDNALYDVTRIYTTVALSSGIFVVVELSQPCPDGYLSFPGGGWFSADI